MGIGVMRVHVCGTAFSVLSSLYQSAKGNDVMVLKGRDNLPTLLCSRTSISRPQDKPSRQTYRKGDQHPFLHLSIDTEYESLRVKIEHTSAELRKTLERRQGSKPMTPLQTRTSTHPVGAQPTRATQLRMRERDEPEFAQKNRDSGNSWIHQLSANVKNHGIQEWRASHDLEWRLVRKRVMSSSLPFGVWLKEERKKKEDQALAELPSQADPELQIAQIDPELQTCPREFMGSNDVSTSGCSRLEMQEGGLTVSELSPSRSNGSAMKRCAQPWSSADCKEPSELRNYFPSGNGQRSPQKLMITCIPRRLDPCLLGSEVGQIS